MLMVLGIILLGDAYFLWRKMYESKKMMKSIVVLFTFAVSLLVLEKSNVVKAVADEGENDIISITTEEILVGQGEVFAMSTNNINELLEESGYDYKSKYMAIYHGDKEITDDSYITKASCLGICDANNGTTIELMYVSSAELNELMRQNDEGELVEKYGTEVLLVEAAEVYAYYARFEKTGKTTITIPHYEV